MLKDGDVLRSCECRRRSSKRAPDLNKANPRSDHACHTTPFKIRKAWRSIIGTFASDLLDLFSHSSIRFVGCFIFHAPLP